MKKGDLVVIDIAKVEEFRDRMLEKPYMDYILDDKERTYRVEEILSENNVLLGDAMLTDVLFSEKELTVHTVMPTNVKEVMRKWNTDGDLAVIYQVENLLFFYSKDPHLKKGQTLTIQEAQATNPYKVITFSMDNVPNDASLAFLF